MSNDQDPVRMARIEVQLGYVVDEQRRTNGVLEDIGDALRQFAVLESKQHEDRRAIERAFSEIDKTNKRVTAIEQEMPMVKLASGWVFKAVLGVLAVLGVAALGIVITGG